MSNAQFLLGSPQQVFYVWKMTNNSVGIFILIFFISKLSFKCYFWIKNVSACYFRAGLTDFGAGSVSPSTPSYGPAHRQNCTCWWCQWTASPDCSRCCCWYRPISKESQEDTDSSRWWWCSNPEPNTTTTIGWSRPIKPLWVYRRRHRQFARIWWAVSGCSAIQNITSIAELVSRSANGDV